MAEESLNNPDLEEALRRADVPADESISKVTKREPIFKMIGDSKIPLPKTAGKLWKSRLSQCRARRTRKGVKDAWEEALDYYYNDQLSHRDSTQGGEVAGNNRRKRKISDDVVESENIVFSNTNSIVPAIYAKNPKCEFTANDDEEMKQLASLLEDLVEAIIAKRIAPGINLKPKVKRNIVLASLTNNAVFSLGYTNKKFSREQAFEDIMRLSKELEKAKEPKEIERIEGELLALQDAAELFRPSGPWCKTPSPFETYSDVDDKEDDYTDANWVITADTMPTAVLLAVYGRGQNMNDEQVKSIYQPTHILTAKESDDPATSAVDAQALFNWDDDGNKSWKDYGFEDEETFNKSKVTKVWYVWDRATRRIYMYNDKDWTWPIWVWDDPYNLDCFFPFVKLSFYTAPMGGETKGEVTYYLDQQDAINEINSERARWRHWLRKVIFYDKNKLSAADAEALLKGDQEAAIPVDVPEGMRITDCVQAFGPPSIQYAEVFDKAPILESADRIASTNEIVRGGQFKTNTTNQAIDTYNSMQNTRNDERIDAVEDAIGQIGWILAQMCLQFMPKEQVATLVGKQRAEIWRNLSPEEIQGSINFRVVGGSTAKPNSKAKKQEAIEAGQVLGQFVEVSPMTLIVMLRMLEQSFDEVVLKEEDWAAIRQSIEQRMMNDTAQAQGQVGGSGQSQPQGPQPNAPQAGGDAQAIIAQLEEVINQLPPQAKQALGTAMAQGVPMREALTRIVQMIQQGAQQ